MPGSRQVEAVPPGTAGLIWLGHACARGHKSSENACSGLPRVTAEVLTKTEIRRAPGRKHVGKTRDLNGRRRGTGVAVHGRCRGSRGISPPSEPYTCVSIRMSLLLDDGCNFAARELLEPLEAIAERGQLGHLTLAARMHVAR